MQKLKNDKDNDIILDETKKLCRGEPRNRIKRKQEIVANGTKKSRQMELRSPSQMKKGKNVSQVALATHSGGYVLLIWLKSVLSRRTVELEDHREVTPHEAPRPAEPRPGFGCLVCRILQAGVKLRKLWSNFGW
jgi:hypothetical protein